MSQAVAYSASEEKMLDSEQEPEMDGVDPWKAAMQGDLDALLQYIDDNGDVNQRDRDNNTPLHWACQESHFDIVGVLMSRNSAVDPVNDLQSTPLHYACREGNLDIVTGLINFNANLEARNKDNLSPLHVAAGMGHIDVTKRLLDNGADMEAEDNALYTPLWRAAYYGHPEVVQVLLDKGANKLARNKKGRKPGDVFSPTVEEDKKDRIKNMLGMGAPQDGVAGNSSTGAGAPIAAATAAAVNKVAASVDGGVDAGRGGSVGAVGGNGVLAGGSNYNGHVSASTLAAAAEPPPAYKPPPTSSSHRVDPAPSAASLADSSYQYPDPSPANSPSSNNLHSAVTDISIPDPGVNTAVRHGGSSMGAGSETGTMANGGMGIAGGGGSKLMAVSVGPGGAGEATTSRTAAGVQTTPSVNGAAEMSRMKAELDAKDQQLKQMNLKVEEYKENLIQTQSNSTRELDDADVQAEQLNQRIAEAETELERKKLEVLEARKEVENAERSSEERIAQLEHDLRLARSESKGCQCTIS